MTYVSWAVLYEGEADAAYFDILIPRVMEDLVMAHGTRHVTIPAAHAVRLQRQGVDAVAQEACKARDAFHLVFIHSDAGGRALETSLARRSIAYCEAMANLCGWNPTRCITISPRHETEAWILADPAAVTSALGYRGDPSELGLPPTAREAEALPDPKSVLRDAFQAARGRRQAYHASRINPAIAQRQTLSVMRQSASFATFEDRLRLALADLGCL